MIRKGMKAMVAALGVTAVVAGASVAQAASNVQIDLDGLGGARTFETIQSIDLNAGNSLAVGATNSVVGEDFDVYFQANISALNLAAGGQVDLTGYTLTTVVKFSEQKAFEAPGVVATFANGSGTDEYFQLWLTPTAGDNLNGTGFGADSGGILLLAGNSINISTGSFTNELVIDPITQLPVPKEELFDQSSDGDNYAGQQSLVGSGATTVSAGINFVNTDYIKGLFSGQTIDLVLANPASNAIPFDAVNPSGQFWDATSASYVTPDLGNVNGKPSSIGGTGEDIQFQTNGNLTFETTSVIPEPATAALGLFGLAGLAIASRRRRA